MTRVIGGRRAYKLIKSRRQGISGSLGGEENGYWFRIGRELGDVVPPESVFVAEQCADGILLRYVGDEDEQPATMNVHPARARRVRPSLLSSAIQGRYRGRWWERLPFGSETYRRRAEDDAQREVSDARARRDLGPLLKAQEKDERLGHRAYLHGGLVSLDAPLWDDGEGTLHDVLEG
jgi:hypothetical protein